MRNCPLVFEAAIQKRGAHARSSTTLLASAKPTPPAHTRPPSQAGLEVARKRNLRPTTFDPRQIQLTAFRCHTLQAEEKEFDSIENYRFVRTLGQGAYAVVKEAVHLPSKERFAVKSYARSRLTDTSKRENVRREIKILQRLDHKHIVKCKDSIDDAKHIHVVMEYVEGISLCSYIKRFPQRRLPHSEARRLFTQLVAALEYCHSHHVTHRDIKLDNVLIDRDNNLKLVDFGFATNSLNPTRIFCGTPSYMAPEIVQKQEYRGPPVDIWALGVVLFVMFHGAFPFKGTNDRELFQKIRLGVFDMPDSTPLHIRLLIKKMLHLNPDIRPTARQLLQNEWVSYDLTTERVRSMMRNAGSMTQEETTEHLRRSHRGYSKRRHFSLLNKENI